MLDGLSGVILDGDLTEFLVIVPTADILFKITTTSTKSILAVTKSSLDLEFARESLTNMNFRTKSLLDCENSISGIDRTITFITKSKAD